MAELRGKEAAGRASEATARENRDENGKLLETGVVLGILMTKQKSLFKPCGICFGRGVMKQGTRWVKCICGRFTDSRGEALLAKQEKLDKRYQELKDKGW